MDAYLGNIIGWAGTYAPRGWVFCEGQTLPVAQNEALFSLLGTTYGGDGRTNFKLPNLKARTIVGARQGTGLSNYNVAQIGGAESIVLTANQMPSHTHIAAINQSKVEALYIQASRQNATTNTPSASNNVMAIPYDTGNASEVYGYNSTPPNTVVNIGNSSPSIAASVTVQTAGNNQPVSVLQPSIGIGWIICVNGGMYPPRP